MKHAILLITLVLCGVLGWSVPASGYVHRGMGYEQALQYRQALTRQQSTRPVGPSAAEKRAIHAWGWRVGRWWDECDRYFPYSQLRNCMYCIKHESRGDPHAYNHYSGAKGLFQLVGYTFNVWPPMVNIHMAHHMWRAYGWSRWSVM